MDGGKDLELPITDSKCYSTVNPITLKPACRKSARPQTNNEDWDAEERTVKYFKPGFPLGSWVPIERITDANGTKIRVREDVSYYPFYQECDRKSKDKAPLEKEGFECYVALKPGCALEIKGYPVEGHLVARWLQGTLKDGKGAGSTTSGFYVTVDDEDFGPEGTVSELFRSTRTVQTTSSAHKYHPEWTEVIQHFKLGPVPFDYPFTFGIENAGSKKSNLFLKGIEFYACPSSYWDGYFGISSPPPISAETTDCDKFSKSTTFCYCQNVGGAGEYEKRCTSSSNRFLTGEKVKEASNSRHGIFIPGYFNDTFYVDCDCKSGIPPSPPLEELPTDPPTPETIPPPPVSEPEPTVVSDDDPPPLLLLLPPETPHILLLCRDFSRFHPDMSFLPGGIEKGMVDAQLNATTRKPAWNKKKSRTFNGKKSFDTWFRNGPWNVAKKAIKLEGFSIGSSSSSKENVPKEYVYGGERFFPFDDDRNKAEGTHNFYFTCEHHGSFVYEEKANQRITFKADDDLWVFVNDKLAVDVGGIHDTETRILDLNELGLINGQTHSIDFFFAQRRPLKSALEIRTNFYFRCASGYDSCGVCKIANPSSPPRCPLDLAFLGTPGEASFSVSQAAPDDGEPGSSSFVRCDSVEPGEPCDDAKSSLKGLGECTLNKLLGSEDAYSFSMYSREGNPIKEPHVLVATLDHYGSSVRRRGNCDSILGGDRYDWNDSTGFWKPTFTDNPDWIVSSFFYDYKSKIINLTRVIKPQKDGRECKDHAGNSVSNYKTFDEGKTKLFSARYTLYAVYPSDLENEYSGERTKALASCYVRIQTCSSSKTVPPFDCVPSEALVFHDPSLFVSGEGDRNDATEDQSIAIEYDDYDDDATEEYGIDRPNGFPLVSVKNVQTTCYKNEKTMIEFSTCSSYRSSEGKHAVKLIFDEAWATVTGLSKNASRSFPPKPLNVLQKVTFERDKAKECDIFGNRSDFFCCQNWFAIFERSKGVESTTELNVDWIANVFDMNFDRSVVSASTVKGEPEGSVSRFSVRSKQKLASLNSYCTKKLIDENPLAVEGNVPGATVKLYDDPHYKAREETAGRTKTNRFDVKDEQRTYAKIEPKTMDKEKCKKGRMVLLEAHLSADDGTKEIEMVTLYQYDHKIQNAMHGSEFSWNADLCYGNFSWVIKVPSFCKSSRVLNYEHLNSKNAMNPRSNQLSEGWTINERTAEIWLNYGFGKRSVNGKDDDGGATEAIDNQNDEKNRGPANADDLGCDVKLWLDWVFFENGDGGGGGGGGDATRQEAENLPLLKKRALQGGGYPIDSFSGTVQTSDIQLEIQCADGQYWNSEAGKCEHPLYKKLFKHMNTELWWGLMAIPAALGILLVLVCLISCGYTGTKYFLKRREAQKAEEIEEQLRLRRQQQQQTNQSGGQPVPETSMDNFIGHRTITKSATSRGFRKEKSQ
jgi:fibro-slime domain-containing protein